VIVDQTKIGRQVVTAVHELAHAMVFSSSLYKFFRNSDGTPMVARDAKDQDAFPNQVKYSCSAGSYRFPDSAGQYKYVDISPVILNTFSERGFTNSDCPIGKASLGSRCFIPSTGFRVPSCVVRFKTPTVLAEARAHFSCNTLEGAELENQDTTMCAITGSHWEQRVFSGELMAPYHLSSINVYVSRVTLALFQDSGWYQVNMNNLTNWSKASIGVMVRAATSRHKSASLTMGLLSGTEPFAQDLVRWPAPWIGCL